MADAWATLKARADDLATARKRLMNNPCSMNEVLVERAEKAFTEAWAAYDAEDANDE